MNFECVYLTLGPDALVEYVETLVMRTRTILAVLLVAQMAASPIASSLTAVERQRLTAHMDMTAAWLIDEVSGLSTAQLHFRPAPDAWSILQVFDHLLVVKAIYWHDLQKAVSGPPSQRGTSTTDADILWYGINRMFREKAIPAEVPSGDLRDVKAGLDTYRKRHAQLREYVRTTNDDLRSHVVERQACDAYQWALLISTHEQRHILQIREIKTHANFPKK